MKFSAPAIALTVAVVQVEGYVQIKTSLPNYLDALTPQTKARSPAAGNYLESVSVAAPRVGGDGIASYLDIINQACDAAVHRDNSECAEVISDYMTALTIGVAP